QDFRNMVTLSYVFRDNSSSHRSLALTTVPFHDPCQYEQGTVVKARTRSTNLSYDFMLLKNSCGEFSPAMMDTDGELRWVGTARRSSVASAFVDNNVFLGAGSQLFRIEFDGTVNLLADYSDIGVVLLHHNIDPGKYG